MAHDERLQYIEFVGGPMDGQRKSPMSVSPTFEIQAMAPHSLFDQSRSGAQNLAAMTADGSLTVKTLRGVYRYWRHDDSTCVADYRWEGWHDD